MFGEKKLILTER